MSGAGGRTVIKLGGSLLDDPIARDSVIGAIARRWRSGEFLVVVHGGGRRIDAELNRRGIPRRTCEGLRVTDHPTLDVVISMLAGIVNKELVAEMIRCGARAAGFSGADGLTLRAERHAPIGDVDLGFVGSVSVADARLLHAVLDAGMLPVIAPIGATPDGVLLNVNADSAAAAVAASLHARRLIFLTDVEGVADENGNLIERLDSGFARELLNGPAIGGGMRPKLRASLAAAEAGVREVIIAGPGNQETAISGGNGGTTLVAA